MHERIDARMAELGIALPAPLPAPRSRMRRLQRHERLVYLSGNGPFEDGRLAYVGKLGSDLTLEQGVQAARMTALNIVRVLRDEGVDLDAITWIKTLGMVNSHPSFTDQPAVVNGFSETIADIFGEQRGLPARSACGMASMPWDMAVEIEAIVAVD